MAKALFDVYTCTGTRLASVNLDVPFNGDDLSVHAEHEQDAIRAAGFNNRVCDGCYDDAYRAKFVGWIKSGDPNGEQD